METNPRIAPSRCVFCEQVPQRQPAEIPYVTPKGEGVCQTHQELLKACGVLLDRAHRFEVTAHRALEQGILRLVETSRPGGWTYDPFQKDRDCNVKGR